MKHIVFIPGIMGSELYEGEKNGDLNVGLP